VLLRASRVPPGAADGRHPGVAAPWHRLLGTRTGGRRVLVAVTVAMLSTDRVILDPVLLLHDVRGVRRPLEVGVNAEQAVHGDAEHRHPRAQRTHEDRSSPR
jgi:hypothetical protein